MKAKFKFTFLTLFLAALSIGFFQRGASVTKTSAAVFTKDDVRIPVVRPDWWEDGEGTKQQLIILETDTFYSRYGNDSEKLHIVGNMPGNPHGIGWHETPPIDEYGSFMIKVRSANEYFIFLNLNEGDIFRIKNITGWNGNLNYTNLDDNSKTGLSYENTTYYNIVVGADAAGHKKIRVHGGKIFITDVIQSDPHYLIANKTNGGVNPANFAKTPAQLNNISYDIGENAYNPEAYTGFDEYNIANDIVYYDVKHSDLVGKYVALARLNAAEDDIYNMTQPELFNNNMLHKNWRIWGNGEGIHRPEIAEAKVNDQTVANILYGYMTCDPNAINGYLAYPQLDASFGLEDRLDREETFVYDFAKIADYETGRFGEFDDESGGNLKVPLGHKIAAMKYYYDESLKNGNFASISRNNMVSMTAVLTIGVLGLTMLAGYYFVSKKTKFAK